MSLVQHLPALEEIRDYEDDIGRFVPTITHLGYRGEAITQTFPEEPQVGSKDVFGFLYKPIQTALANRGKNIEVLVKTYNDLPHNSGGDTNYQVEYDWVQPYQVDNYLKVNLINQPDRCGALSGIIRINDSLYIAPTIDLEIPLGDQRLENEVCCILSKLKITGYLVNSGGSCHFIGDYFLPYGKPYLQFLGLIIQHLVEPKPENPQSCIITKSIGERLQRATGQQEVYDLVQEIFRNFPSLPKGEIRKDLLCDIRWIGRRLEPAVVDDRLLEIGVNSLRVTKSRYKGYPKEPYMISQVIERE